MLQPPQWSAEQLESDLKQSIDSFRQQRMAEPLEMYLDLFEDYQGNVEDLLETTIDLANLDDAAIDVLTNPQLQHAFRYLAGPPISADDLKTIADVRSLNPGRLRRDSESVRRVIQTVRDGLDRRRFPWVSEEREPTEDERKAAILASAALMATQRIGTNRRSQDKIVQEGRVEGALIANGLKRVNNRRVQTPTKAPAPGEFCGESKLGTRKADFIVRLLDGRIMPIECKVSNSATNSVKRLNNDAAIKAEVWRKDFGVTQVVPTAVLSGVYKLHNLVEAQERGLAIFWAHNLKALTDWIETPHA